MTGIVECYWLDGAARNEEAEITFDVVNGHCWYTSTVKYRRERSPRWTYTFDIENQIIRIPQFRYRHVANGEFSHEVTMSWAQWHYRCWKPHGRIIVVPKAHVMSMQQGPDLRLVLPTFDPNTMEFLRFRNEELPAEASEG